jgi:hypothetical protein
VRQAAAPRSGGIPKCEDPLVRFVEAIPVVVTDVPVGVSG